MRKTVAAIALVAAIPMLFVGSSSAVAQAGRRDRQSAGPSAVPAPQATTAIRRPIAYGYINTNGTVASGSGNFTSVFDWANNWYAITITGRNYFFTNFSTVVTPSFNSSAAPICGNGSVGGNSSSRATIWLALAYSRRPGSALAYSDL